MGGHSAGFGGDGELDELELEEDDIDPVVLLELLDRDVESPADDSGTPPLLDIKLNGPNVG